MFISQIIKSILFPLKISRASRPSPASNLFSIGYIFFKAKSTIFLKVGESSITKTDFPDPKNTDIDPEVYPKGRIFSDDFELRWEKRNGGYSCVLAVTTDCKWKPENLSHYFFETNEIANEFSRGSGGVIEDYSVFLRLEKDPSLGRSLKYKCIQNGSTKGKLNPVLHLKRYRDARGQLIFWRYCKMEWKV